MQRTPNALLISASDLVSFVACEHLTSLDWQATTDAALRKRRDEMDASGALITSRGNQHEQQHLAQLRASGLQVVDINEETRESSSKDERVARTLDALRSGVDVIYQATLRDGDLIGHADFLMRVDGQPSALGTWRYEVADTKLARTPQAKFLIQLAFYSRLLTLAQGTAPELMHVVLGDNTQRSFRFADHGHYLDNLIGRFRERMRSLEMGPSDSYPEPVAACDTCHWRSLCAERRLADDHLCQVAGVQRSQWLKLQAAGISTLEALAQAPADLQIPKIQPQTIVRLQAQASLQHRGRTTGQRHVELIDLDAEGLRGFHRLPQPDDGDLFFDMEGNPLEPGGLEYLFGLWHRHPDLPGEWEFRTFWAHDRAQEREAFEAFMDFVMAWLHRHSQAHIYHYAAYEETALKRLASQHATREVEVDQLLRRRALVDLYKVVREGLRISEPSYSIKYVEHFYRRPRAGDVQNAGASIVFYEHWRETQDPQLLKDIADYNRDDVESTQQLRDWLLTLRAPALPWFSADAAHQNEQVKDDTPRATAVQEAEARLRAYQQVLIRPLPDDRREWTDAHHQQELIFQLLDFHRRAQKPEWWAMFSRMEQDTEALLEDAECLAGLTLDPRHPPRSVKKSIEYTYCVPEQQSKLMDGDSCTLASTGENLGKLRLSEDGRTAVLKRGANRPMPTMLDLGPGKPIDPQRMVNALFRFADSWLAAGQVHNTPHPTHKALHDLLARRPPDLEGLPTGQPIVPEGMTPLDAAIRAVQAMRETCLYVQGPPGSGKTYTGSRMIATLLREGHRVGVMSNSHKAIHHLTAKALDVATEWGLRVHTVKKAAADRPDTELSHPHQYVVNERLNEDVAASGAQLVAGTAWLFADEAMNQTLDYLFVDEAGQVSLANLIAAGTCARNIVLLGDQMQLSQPVQGVHPGRSGDSALDHLLDGRATIPPERGIFLATSYRMHPDVCRFISDAVYDGRLRPEASNVQRTLVLQSNAHPWLRPAGLVHAPTSHTGCSQGSEEEAQAVLALYQSALKQHYTDEHGHRHAMTPDNILVVAPYNVQVNLLQRTLPADARVGTVDKFQGQEAELVIVSMTTSGPDDLPRDIEFLFSKNRLNVAISRAKCLAVVLANPRLLSVRCQTPEQMALVNLLCWVAADGKLPDRATMP